ncbi:uncharacterized protein [Haliotis asinina]|uniref:uncharacterized protein n=1 Tax=Haliotis asinina TaxID=109174 RepID=UPI0035325247
MASGVDLCKLLSDSNRVLNGYTNGEGVQSVLNDHCSGEDISGDLAQTQDMHIGEVVGNVVMTNSTDETNNGGPIKEIMAKFERDLADLRGELIQEIDYLNQKITQLQCDNKQLTRDRDGVNNELKKTNEYMEKLKQSTVKAVERMRKENNDRVTEVEACKSQLQSTHTDMLSLRKELDRYAKLQNEIVTEASKLKESIEELNSSNKRMDKRVTDLRKHVSDANMKLEEKSLEITRFSDDRSLGITNLKSKVSLLTNGVNSLESDIAEVDKSCKSIEHAMVDLRKKVVTLEKQLKQTAGKKCVNKKDSTERGVQCISVNAASQVIEKSTESTPKRVHPINNGLTQDKTQPSCLTPEVQESTHVPSYRTSALLLETYLKNSVLLPQG